MFFISLSYLTIVGCSQCKSSFYPNWPAKLSPHIYNRYSSSIIPINPHPNAIFNIFFSKEASINGTSYPDLKNGVNFYTPLTNQENQSFRSRNLYVVLVQSGQPQNTITFSLIRARFYE